MMDIADWVLAVAVLLLALTNILQGNRISRLAARLAQHRMDDSAHGR